MHTVIAYGPTKMTYHIILRLNWKTLSMSFMDQGRMIYIKGILPYKKDCEPLIFKEEEENVAVLMC